MKTHPSSIGTEKQMSGNLPLFMILGALSWSIGVIFIRVAGTTFFVKSSFWLMGLYVLTIPAAWLAVKGITLLSKELPCCQRNYLGC
jgi:hypothetical protein